MIKFSKDGLPLKISAEWTSDHYTNQDRYGNITEVGVDGWLVRINGYKYPRKYFDEQDYSYRYTPPAGNTDQGKKQAIENALQDGNYV